MNLLLVNPRKRPHKDERDVFDFRYVTKFLGKQGTAGLALALPTVAGLTPKGVDIEIVDENWQTIDFDADCDVVGITAMTLQSIRAYEIADEFRARGKTVILGGMHPSTLPSEAAKHADCVVAGEIEDIWADVVEDYRQGRLQPFYRAPGFPDLVKTPFARRDLIANEHYMGDLVQSSRGCPFDCDFCSIQKFLGQKMRFKENEQFIRELRHIYEFSGRSPYQKVLVVTDDNFYGVPTRTKSLLKDMIKLNREMPISGWFCQCTMNVAQDDECLELLAEAGCKNIELGIESLSDANLVDGIGKRINKVDAYSWTIERIRNAGMDAVCSFIFGGENDTPKVFENTVRFIEDNHIITAVLNIATPLPGTDYFTKMEREGRILHKDWSLFDTQHCVIKPKGMSERDLEEGYIWANKEIFSLKSLSGKLQHHTGRMYHEIGKFDLLRAKVNFTANLLKKTSEIGAEHFKWAVGLVPYIFRPDVDVQLPTIVVCLDHNDFSRQLEKTHADYLRTLSTERPPMDKETAEAIFAAPLPPPSTEAMVA